MSETPQLSVVVPVHNEEDNVAPLVAEIVSALRGLVYFEIVYVDDTSRDATLQRLRDLQAATPELRVIRHLANAGQSTAVRNGVKAARAPWIAIQGGDPRRARGLDAIAHRGALAGIGEVADDAQFGRGG
ncbi:MAG: glycosyltransferase family 2 protein, partial [Lysobacteraceae bacterium]